MACSLILQFLTIMTQRSIASVCLSGHSNMHLAQADSKALRSQSELSSLALLKSFRNLNTSMLQAQPLPLISPIFTQKPYPQVSSLHTR